MSDTPRQDCHRNGCDLFNMAGSMYCHKHWVKTHLDYRLIPYLAGICLGIGITVQGRAGIVFTATSLGLAVIDVYARHKDYSTFTQALKMDYKHKWGVEEEQIP